MTTMKERLARAICQASGFDPDGPTCDVHVKDDPVAGVPWAGYRNHAEAVLREMLVGLSEPMIISAAKTKVICGKCDLCDEMLFSEAIDCYKAAIQAAIDE